MKRVAWLATLIVLATLLVAPATAQVFDNSGGGNWKEYFSFPITTVPSEYAQYKIVINGNTWEIYNVTGGLEATGANSNFWSSVQSDGDDIRVFRQNYNQLYFWIESWDYNNQSAVIWVNLTANSTELNVAYGNPSATQSSYHNASLTFMLYDDFSTDTIASGKWTVVEGDWSVVDGKLVLHFPSNQIYNQRILATNFNTGRNIVVETSWMMTTQLSTGVLVLADTATFSGYIIRHEGSGYNTFGIIRMDDGSGTGLTSVSKSYSTNTWYLTTIKVTSDQIIATTAGTTIQATDTTYLNGTVGLYGQAGVQNDNGGDVYFDWIRVYKLADPVDFGNGIVKLFQEKFGTKTTYVNVTYLDTETTERFNPPAYYKLEDKPQINISSTLSISGVNATYGANISIELIEFVTLDKVIYNGTEVTVTYEGTKTNETTGLIYNVYNFTTYENGTLEIYGHVGNKAYEATFKLDGETVYIFNVTAVIGEILEIVLPHRGNVTLESIEYTNVTSATINTKNVGTGAKTLSIVIGDPENFTVGLRSGIVNIDWGKIYFNITDLQNKSFTGATYGIFNKRFSIVSTDPTKLYAGDNAIDIYFHGVKLKSLEIYLNHTNNGLTLNISVNATQPKDYRGLTRIIASPNYFEIVNLSESYPFSVMKIVNASGIVVVDYVSNAPTSIEVVGATSYTYEKPVLKITASGNVTVTDLYRLSISLKDRLGNPVNFYVLINGSRVDASNGIASKLLKPSWYEVKVPITVSGFELWKFNDSSNIALVEINTSDKTLPTAEYRVPSKIETKEVRIQKMQFPWLPFPFLSESKPAQEETPIVRLEGTLRDFYNAPVANRTIKIEVASPNFTRIYNVTTDSSGNFKIEVDMAKGVEYKVTYKFTGDDVYVGTSTTKTFTIEQLLPAPPEEMTIEEILIFVSIAVGLVAVIVGVIYLAKRTKAKALARMESEFKFFRRIR